VRAMDTITASLMFPPFVICDWRFVIALDIGDLRLVICDWRWQHTNDFQSGRIAAKD